MMNDIDNDVAESSLHGIVSMKKLDKYYLIKFRTKEISRLFILNDHVFRYYMSPTGEFLDYPEPMDPEDNAKIIYKDMDNYGYNSFENSSLHDMKTHYVVKTQQINILLDKINATMKVHDVRNGKDVLVEARSLSYTECKVIQTLQERPQEYFFGGGMQNGRFTHKNQIIDIMNTNNWLDGGVTSPCPFYWSTNGYGILRNTWQPGIYDFGAHSYNTVKTIHKGEYYDAYFFINSKPRHILRDYYELSGNPLLLPEFAYYEAHLNAFNRDYWVQVTNDTRGAILFEDGKYYKSYKPNEMDDKVGILESLNGEKDNYQFSARAMLDRYKKHDMPLGWFIPNDGYGCGYGQTDSLEGDLQNLKRFVDYAEENGVRVGLWTESKLEPVDPVNPRKGDRDLAREVGFAKIVALKCDVAWIGSGYSFGLSAVENAANIFTKNSSQAARPFIIMVDGWAGTQRHAGIWSGDQTGGQWEYIRFHIPTYIGSGLSGIPIVGSDMDGIYGGGDIEVNIRDFQWKSFTSLQLNMDGWGRMPKTPFSYDEDASRINRGYLKLKSMFLPYNYTLGYEAINGLPPIRAMFLEFPNETSSYTIDSQYQYMWGPNILVAPIYNDNVNEKGSVRNGIYLPDEDQLWIDLFTGEKYQGGKIFNNFIAPLWKIPVFIKNGAIIPLIKPNNNPYEIKRDCRIFAIYPNKKSEFSVYEDDGITSEYQKGHKATTNISVTSPDSDATGNVLIVIKKTVGSYSNMIKERITILQIMASHDVDSVKIAINGDNISVPRVYSEDEFNDNDISCYYYNKDFVINPYMKELNDFKQKMLQIKIGKIDVTTSETYISINKYTNKSNILGKITNASTDQIPKKFTVDKEETTPYTISLKWESTDNVSYYEIERDGTVFTNIMENNFAFEDFPCDSSHAFRIRSVTDEIASEWSELLTAKTLNNPFKNIIQGVKVSCNLPCQPCQEIQNLSIPNSRHIWHTHWTHGKVKSDDFKLFFDLGAAYDVEKVVYLPRDDAGNGTILEIQYRSSIDNEEWTALSDVIIFNHDNKPKNINFSGLRFRYIEFTVINTIGGFGSGKHMVFFKH
ncbi:unnamed protein product [Leptidea sinapis]|uniref:F5/8 type C domain-containing protein n=1 Tax=Leptidea sinapis TaxID=189913 RepID=A0A5E4PNK2_9NEOP|nr:unnamed protein product [Leptidea sinapis]